MSEYYSYSTGGYVYKFYLQNYSSEVRIYIKNRPSYESRSTCYHATHRLSDNNGDYICIRSDLVPTNISDAKSWASYWALKTSDYIKHGYNFS